MKNRNIKTDNITSLDLAQSLETPVKWDILGVIYWEENNPFSGETTGIKLTDGGFSHTTENGGTFFVSSDD